MSESGWAVADLPTSVELGGVTYEIRTDYRAVLDIITALNDPDLTDEDKAEATLAIFYPAFDEMPVTEYKAALDFCFWFINNGEDDDDGQTGPRVVDWQQDFKLIIAPINHILGQEVRAIPYDEKENKGGLHWWTFLSAYNEINGECTFAQVVSLRSKLAAHKKLDKVDKEWYRRNRKMVDLKQRYSQGEEDFLVKMGLKKK